MGFLIAVLAAGAAVWILRWVWRFLAIGAAYKSKILSSAIFGSGLDLDPNTAPEVSADAYWFLRIFHSRADRASRSVTTSFLGLRPHTRTYVGAPGLKSRPMYAKATSDNTAYVGRDFSPAVSRPAVPGPAVPHPADAGPAVDPRLAIPWAQGTRSSSLDRVIELAFRESSPRRLRRTRAIVVVHDGRIVGERYAAGISEDTLLPGWSMAKSVLGTLVGVLVGEGKLSLNDTELLPEWKRPDKRADIRLEDLLRMRSGLRFVENYSNPGSDVVRMLFEQRDAAAFAASRPLKSTPGTVWSYSSGTSNIISRIVRARVGDEYPDWPRRVLFDPIGMTSAVMEPDASGTFVASSFMLATARDWARFGQLHVQEGMWDGRTIVPRSWINYMTTATPESERQAFGAHWWLKISPEMGGDTEEARRIPADAYHALGHEGQTLTIIPSRKLVIVRLGLSIYIDAWDHARFVSEVLDAI